MPGTFAYTFPLTDQTHYPDVPADDAAARQQFMDLFTSVQNNMNNNLIQLTDFPYFVDSGAVNAIVGAITGFTAYTAGSVLKIKATVTNTGATTVNINSLGAKTLKKITGSGIVDLGAGDIQAGAIFFAIFDGTNYLTNLGLVSHLADYASRFGSAGALVTDLNAITEAGFFCHSTNAANAAGAAAGLVKHEHYDSNFAYQEEIISGIKGKFIRIKNAGIWGAWRQILTGDSIVLLWSGSTSAVGQITLTSSCTYTYDAFLIMSGTGTSAMYYLIECPPPGKLSLISSNQVLNYSTCTGVGQLQGVDSSGLYLNLAVTGGQPLRTIYGIIRGDRV